MAFEYCVSLLSTICISKPLRAHYLWLRRALRKAPPPGNLTSRIIAASYYGLLMDSIFEQLGGDGTASHARKTDTAMLEQRGLYAKHDGEVPFSTELRGVTAEVTVACFLELLRLTSIVAREICP